MRMKLLERACGLMEVLKMKGGRRIRRAISVMSSISFTAHEASLSAEAVEALRPFVNTMHNRISGSDRLADAAADAVGALVQRLEAKGIAANDLWEEAIEASLSFANETQLI